MTVQPNPDWPWSLSEGGNLAGSFDWHDIEFALEDLYPDNDSFLILEQKDPQNDKNYWYIQRPGPGKIYRRHRLSGRNRAGADGAVL